MKKIISAITAGALTLSIAACNTPGERAVGGAAIGGLAGAAIGGAATGRAGGALAGAAIGAAGGAGIGLALGGPIGALLGGVAGHMLVDREGAPFGRPPRDVVFTMGLVALAAKMAKSDGVVVTREVEAFERIVEVPPADHDRVKRL